MKAVQEKRPPDELIDCIVTRHFLPLVGELLIQMFRCNFEEKMSKYSGDQLLTKTNDRGSYKEVEN